MRSDHEERGEWPIPRLHRWREERGRPAAEHVEGRPRGREGVPTTLGYGDPERVRWDGITQA